MLRLVIILIKFPVELILISC